MKPVIQIENLCKRFVLDVTPLTAYNLFNRMAFPRRLHKVIWALQDINIEINPGDRVGIIGDNGSGKTTLLRIMAGLYLPTKGRLDVRGETAAFLQMGIGMERDLTALENIYLFGAIMGMSTKKIERELEGIIEFAEIGEYVHCPLRDFSSGMIQRVAFAIARVVEAETLMLDEMLATGDIGFREKCYHVLEGYVNESRTVIITSHETEMIRKFCNKCLWLDKGGQKAFGPANDILRAYIQSKNME